MEHQRRVAKWGPATGRPAHPASRVLTDLYRTLWPLGMFAVIYLVGQIIARFVEPHALLRSFPWVMGALVCGLGISKLVTWRRSRYQAEPTHLTDGTPRLSVTMQLFAKKLLYGEDKGEILVVDNWLVFEGERTSFSLAPHDVGWPYEKEKVGGREAAGLMLKGIPADVHIVFISEDLKRTPKSFLAPWSVRRVHDLSAVSVLPPLEPMAGFALRGGYSDSKDGRVARYLAMLPVCTYLPFIIRYDATESLSLLLRILDIAATTVAFFSPYLLWYGVARYLAVASLRRARNGLQVVGATQPALENPPAVMPGAQGQPVPDVVLR